MSAERDRTSKEKPVVEQTEQAEQKTDTRLVEGELPEVPELRELRELRELPDRRCIDLEFLLLSLPASAWVVTVRESHTSLGEDLPIADNLVGGRTRVGQFTGRRRL
jgi:hypothetical protein